MSELKRLEEIDAMKGIAIFLVILGHSIIFYPVNLHENIICAAVFKWLSGVHMPLFFIVSGFCFLYKGNYKTYAIKKGKRLMIPYLVFSMLDLLPRVLASSLVNRSGSVREVIWNILLKGGEYWFLYALFLMFLFMPLLATRARKSMLVTWVVLAILVVCNLLSAQVTDFLCLNYILKYCVFFWLGFLIRCNLGTKIFLSDLFCTGKYAAFLLTLGLWMMLLYFDLKPTILISCVGILTVYFWILMGWGERFFARIGEYSLQLYLLNGFLLVISRTIIVSVLGVSNPLIIVGFNMMIDLGVSYFIIKKICARFALMRFLMGM